MQALYVEANRPDLATSMVRVNGQAGGALRNEEPQGIRPDAENREPLSSSSGDQMALDSRDSGNSEADSDDVVTAAAAAAAFAAASGNWEGALALLADAAASVSADISRRVEDKLQQCVVAAMQSFTRNGDTPRAAAIAAQYKQRLRIGRPMLDAATELVVALLRGGGGLRDRLQASTALEHARAALFALVGAERAFIPAKSSKESTDAETLLPYFERLLLATHYAASAARYVRSNNVALTAECAASLLRYTGGVSEGLPGPPLIAPDAAYYLAGMAAVDAGDTSSARELLSKFLDIVDAATDGRDPIDDDNWWSPGGGGAGLPTPGEWARADPEALPGGAVEAAREWVLGSVLSVIDVPTGDGLRSTLASRCPACAVPLHAAALTCIGCGTQFLACAATGARLPTGTDARGIHICESCGSRCSAAAWAASVATGCPWCASVASGGIDAK